MSLSKGILAFGLAGIFIAGLTACGGGGSKPPAPPAQLVIVTSSLPPGAVNINYQTYLSATGGTGTYTWCVVESSGACDNGKGTLPPGLTMDMSTSYITGTPVQPFGNYPFTAQVKDASGTTATAKLALYIEGAPVVSPANKTLPTGSLNIPYSQQLTVTGGLAPYTWCVVGGDGSTCDATQAALPPGLTLDAGSGLISGTPTANSGPVTFTVKVADSEPVPAYGSATYSITIITINTTTVPPATANQPYSTTLTASGGQGKLSWCVFNSGGTCDPAGQGTLPPGITMNVGGTISGTATKLGSYPFTAQVCDAQKTPQCTTAQFILVVQFVIDQKVLPQGTQNLAYSTTLTATGGTAPYTWSLVSGTLPAGLSLDPSGLISGTPTTVGTSSFTVQATDANGNTSTALLSIIINPAITNAALTGNYTFTFSGYKGGNLVVMAGAFVANGDGTFKAVSDGSGKLCNATVSLIYAGCLDYNDGSGESLQGGTNPIAQLIVATQSSYAITPNGLGTMKLVTDQGNTFNFHVAIKSDGNGTLIEDSADPQQGSGVIKKQTPGDFQVGSVNGQWALAQVGWDPAGKRYATAGAYATNPITMLDIDCGTSTWNLPNGNCPGDSDDAGTVAGLEFKGTYSGFIDANVGRGNFVKYSYFSGTTLLYTLINTYYIVSHNEFVVVSTTQVQSGKLFPLVLTSVRRQIRGAQGFQNTDLKGTSVMQLGAVDTNGAADVTAGLFVADGAGNATFSYDQNAGGVASKGKITGITYSVSSGVQGSGRVQTTGFGSTSPVLYLYIGNTGFVVGTDPAVSSGVLEPQTGNISNNNAIVGPYAGGTVLPVIATVTNAVTWLSSDGNGNINGTSDTSGPGGDQQQNFTYTYAVDSTGRIVFTGTTPAVGYVISPSKFVLLPTSDPNPALSVFAGNTSGN